MSGYNNVKPKRGSSTITNIVNFLDSNSTFGSTDSTLKIWGQIAIMILIYFVISGIMMALFGNLFLKIIIWIINLLILLRVISRFVFNEKAVREDYLKRNETGDDIDPLTFWGIYDFRDYRPYILYYLDGSIGMAFQLVRASTVGDTVENSFLHYEALASMLRFARSQNILVSTIDIQASDTRDKRLDEVFDNLNSVKNPTLEKILAGVYTYWQESSVSSRMSYETVILKYRGSEQELWENAQIILAEALKGNYKGYVNLSPESLRSTICSLYGLNEFRLREATDRAAESSGTTSIKFLWVANAEGKRKFFNGVSAEVKEEVTVDEETEYNVSENELLDVFSDELTTIEPEKFINTNTDITDQFFGD